MFQNLLTRREAATYLGIADSFSNYVSESGETDDFFSDEDEDLIYRILVNLANERLSEFCISYDTSDVEELTNSIDIDDLINGNIKRSIRDYQDDDPVDHVDGDWSAIDKLFEVDLPRC